MTEDSDLRQAEDLRVDDLVVPWRPDEAEALGRCAQGHVLDVPPLLWAERVPVPEARSLPGAVPDGRPTVPAAWQVSRTEASFRFAAITSQTCDIGAQPPGDRHPFVQVSPVVSLDGLSPDAVDAVQRHARADLVALTVAPADGLWAVDLRVSVPVDKRALLSRTPLPGFATEDDLPAFAERLATRSLRPALHPSLSEDLPLAVTELMRTQRKDQPEWWQKVEQLRVNVSSGTRLEPLRVRLVVVELLGLEAAERQVWRGWAKTFGKKLRARGGPHMDRPSSSRSTGCPLGCTRSRSR